MPTTQPFDFSRLLQPFLQAGAQAGANRLFGLQPGGMQLGGLTLPNALAGAGLLTGGALLDREPGEVAEARQFLRNRFTSPNALSQQFSGQIGGLAESFQPLLTQQRQRGIQDIQQRFIAAFPKTVGAQGPEFGALARFLTDEALPREQAVLGDIGRQLLTEQGRAAETILRTNEPNPFASALSQFGGLLLARDLLGTGRGNQLGVGTDGAMLDQFRAGLLPGEASAFTNQLGLTGTGSAPGAMAFMHSVQSLLPGVQIGAFEALGNGAVGVLDQSGKLVASIGANGQVINQQTGQVLGRAALTTDFGLPGPGLLGPAGTTGTGLLSSAGSVAGGFFVGREIGKRFAAPESTASGVKAGLGGAAGGAVIGFAVGGPPGAVIGAIAGGIGGIFGERGARHERKEAQLKSEIQATSQARPQAQALFSNVLGNLDGLYQRALALQDGPADQALLARERTDPAFAASLRPLKEKFGATESQGVIRGFRQWLEQTLNSLRSAHPEGLQALLASNETGKFGPGVDLLNKILADANAMAQRLEALMASV